jgi:hypothetical protein
MLLFLRKTPPTMKLMKTHIKWEIVQFLSQKVDEPAAKLPVGYMQALRI